MIIKYGKSSWVAKIENREVGDAKTLDEALKIYVTEMKKETGEIINPKTVIVMEHLPHEKVYKFIRIR